MKKISLVVFVFGATIILSGCSIGSFSPMGSDNQKGKKVSPEDSTAKSPLERKIVMGSVWKTSDGGHSFESKSKLDMMSMDVENINQNEDEKDSGDNNTDKAQTKAVNPEGELISTADILSIAFHPAKVKNLYLSTANDGLFKTEDGGELWKPVSFPPKNVTSFILDKNDPDNRMFASGVVGNWGKIFRTSDGGENWEEVYTEPGEKVPVTALAQHTMDNSIVFAGTKAGTVVKSIDGGGTWKNVGQMEDYLNWDKDRKNKRLEIGKKITGNVSEFVFDAKNKAIVYMMTYEGQLYYSGNLGERWKDWELEKKRELERMREKESSSDVLKIYSERMRKEATPRGIVSIASNMTVPGLVYAGTKDGLFVSTSYGKWWNEVAIIESAKKYPIRSIAINPKKPEEIIFVAGKAFYKSVDDGKTWEVVGLDVDRDASFIAYDPFDPNFIFIGLRIFK